MVLGATIIYNAFTGGKPTQDEARFSKRLCTPQDHLHRSYIFYTCISFPLPAPISHTPRLKNRPLRRTSTTRRR